MVVMKLRLRSPQRQTLFAHPRSSGVARVELRLVTLLRHHLPELRISFSPPVGVGCGPDVWRDKERCSEARSITPGQLWPSRFRRQSGLQAIRRQNSFNCRFHMGCVPFCSRNRCSRITASRSVRLLRSRNSRLGLAAILLRISRLQMEQFTELLVRSSEQFPVASVAASSFA